MSQLNQPDIDLDRRNSTCVGFDAQLSVCEYDPLRSGGADDFRPVKSSDLSQTGTAFVSIHWPRSDRLMLRFGESNPSQAIACVVNIRCVDTNEEVRRCEFQEWLPPASEG
jgi:hypothetical protein